MVDRIRSSDPVAGGDEAVIAGQRFRIAWKPDKWKSVPESTSDVFVLLKRPEMVRDYLRRFRSDRPRNIVELGVFQELEGEAIDFVLDDASHLYGPTRATFEALFPMVRPGGTYVIEDWGWAHWAGSPWQDGSGPYGDEPGMSNLLFELVMLSATRPDIVGSVDARFHEVVIVRGPARLDAPIVLEQLYANRGRPFRPVV